MALGPCKGAQAELAAAFASVQWAVAQASAPASQQLNVVSCVCKLCSVLCTDLMLQAVALKWLAVCMQTHNGRLEGGADPYLLATCSDSHGLVRSKHQQPRQLLVQIVWGCWTMALAARRQYLAQLCKCMVCHGQGHRQDALPCCFVRLRRQRWQLWYTTCGLHLCACHCASGRASTSPVLGNESCVVYLHRPPTGVRLVRMNKWLASMRAPTDFVLGLGGHASGLLMRNTAVWASGSNWNQAGWLRTACRSSKQPCTAACARTSGHPCCCSELS